MTSKITLLNQQKFDQTWSEGIPWNLSMLSGEYSKIDWAEAAQKKEKICVVKFPEFFFGSLPEGAKENKNDGSLCWDPSLINFDTALELYQKAHLKAIRAVEECLKILSLSGYELDKRELEELSIIVSQNHWLSTTTSDIGVLIALDKLFRETVFRQFNQSGSPDREAKVIASLKKTKEANNSLLLAYLVYAIYNKVNWTFTVSSLPEAFFTKGGGLIVKVPKEDMGRYIGRGGSNIKEVSAALKEAGIKFFKVVEK